MKLRILKYLKGFIITYLTCSKDLVMIIVQLKKLPLTSLIARSDKGKIRSKKPVSHRATNHFMIEVRRNPLETSKEVFESVGVSGVR